MSTASTTVFVADNRVENWLKSFDIEYSAATSIRLSDINVKESRKNQARLEAIIPEAVESYQQSIRNGDDLPAVVVHKRGNSYVVIDGNNRLEAARREGAARVMAYIVNGDVSSELLMLMTLSANATNGAPMSKEWKQYCALTLISNGYTKEITAQHLRLPVSSIEGFLRAKNAEERARKLRISGWTDIPSTTRATLARIKLDSVLMLVAEAVVTFQLKNSSELNAIVVEVNKLRSETDAIETARNWCARQKEQAIQLRRMGRKRGITNPKMGVLSALGQLNSFPLGQFHTVFSSDGDREVLSERIDQGLKALAEMKAKLVGGEEAQEALLSIAETLE